MSSLIEQLQELLDPGGLIIGEEAREREDGWSWGLSQSRIIVRPKNTDQVSQIMKICHERGQAVVTHGGKTGMVQGCIAGPNDLVLSLERMTAIEEVDETGRTMTVQAGVVMQLVQERAEELGLMYPVDLGARGSATIGGNIATNAGGNSVIRYGMTREQVLGLEVVMADGRIVSSLNRMIKNNAGYDLKQLFIGSEGTLGIVTRAVLRLRTKLPSENTALVAVNEFDDLSVLLKRAEGELGGRLSAFEVMWNSYYEKASQREGHQMPLPAGYPFYVLIETTGSDQQLDGEGFQNYLEGCMAAELIVDAVLAQSGSERDNLWAIRDNVESMMALWPPYIFDISLGIDLMQDYLDDIAAQLSLKWPDTFQQAIFGHLGDGNLHLVISVGSEDPAVRHQVEDVVYSSLQSRGGSISAEHGIGLEKRDFLHYSRSDEELGLMRLLKQSLDPKGILNPGKLLSAAE